jgi:hypothetical protein
MFSIANGLGIQKEHMRSARKIAKKYHRYWAIQYDYCTILSEAYWGLVNAYVRRTNGKIPAGFPFDAYVEYRIRRTIRNFFESIAKFKHRHEENQVVGYLENQAIAKSIPAFMEGYLEVLENDFEYLYITNILEGRTDEEFRNKFEELSIHTFYKMKEEVLGRLESYFNGTYNKSNPKPKEYSIVGDLKIIKFFPIENNGKLTFGLLKCPMAQVVVSNGTSTMKLKKNLITDEFSVDHQDTGIIDGQRYKFPIVEMFVDYCNRVLGVELTQSIINLLEGVK